MSWIFLGLTDRVLGRAWNREPTVLVDYLYGERRPDTLHLHGSWLAANRCTLLWPFHDQYRAMGPKFLARLSLAPLSAVRADLVDPAVPPVLPMVARVGVVEVKGISAILGKAETVFFVHALQVQARTTPRAGLERPERQALADRMACGIRCGKRTAWLGSPGGGAHAE